jgi:hypothetical protein
MLKKRKANSEVKTLVAPPVSSDAYVSNITEGQLSVLHGEHGYLHNLAGPAIVAAETSAYYIHGVNVTKDVWSTARCQLITPKREYIMNKGYCTIWTKTDAAGNKVLHANLMPAISSENGDYEYHVNGLKHRIGGPAVSLEGAEFYFLQGLNWMPDAYEALSVCGKRLEFTLDGESKFFDKQGREEPVELNHFSICNSEYQSFKDLNPRLLEAMGASFEDFIDAIVYSNRYEPDRAKVVKLIRDILSTRTFNSIQIFINAWHALCRSTTAHSSDELKDAMSTWLASVTQDLQPEPEAVGYATEAYPAPEPLAEVAQDMAVELEPIEYINLSSDPALRDITAQEIRERIMNSVQNRVSEMLAEPETAPSTIPPALREIFEHEMRERIHGKELHVKAPKSPPRVTQVTAPEEAVATVADDSDGENILAGLGAAAAFATAIALLFPRKERKVKKSIVARHEVVS